MIDKRQLFRLAWANARHIARRGVAIRPAFALALRAAWASLKASARIAASLSAETAALVASLAAGRALGVRFGTTKPWRFANAGV